MLYSPCPVALWQYCLRTRLIPYRKGNKWGYCTPDKKIVIPCNYDWTKCFYKEKYGFAAVRKEEHYGLIEKTGRLVLPCEYDPPYKKFQL